jgi:hypothetical protein
MVLSSNSSNSSLPEIVAVADKQLDYSGQVFTCPVAIDVSLASAEPAIHQNAAIKIPVMNGDGNRLG